MNNSLPASGDFSRLLIILANILDLDQAGIPERNFGKKNPNLQIKKSLQNDPACKELYLICYKMFAISIIHILLMSGVSN